MPDVAALRRRIRVAMIVRAMGHPPDDDDDLDEASAALLQAVEEYIAGRQASRAWDPAKHPRDARGRFLSTVDQLKDKLEAHFNGGDADPFDGYSREQLRRVARRRGIALDRGEPRESISEKLLDHIEPRRHERRQAAQDAARRQREADEAARKAAANAGPYAQPTSTPTRMTKAQYTKLLKDEHIRLQMLAGKSEKEAKALARPAATIDDLKARNSALRSKLRAAGIDYRTEEQRNTDDAAKNDLLDQVQQLAEAGGHDGAAKRAAAARLSVPELRKLIADTRAYQQRQQEKARAAERGRAAEEAFQQRQATLTATPRQVDYILNLLVRRARSGEGGGFFLGPTDRAGIAKLTRGEASAYINSLTGNY